MCRSKIFSDRLGVPRRIKRTDNKGQDMNEIKINENDMIDILKEWDEDRFENKPLDAMSFSQYIFHKYQPERSKREDLENKYESYFPPPWHIYEHPEKTEGWIEFQKEMRKDPKYYLGCGALNSMET